MCRPFIIPRLRDVSRRGSAKGPTLTPALAMLGVKVRLTAGAMAGQHGEIVGGAGTDTPTIKFDGGVVNMAVRAEKLQLLVDHLTVEHRAQMAAAENARRTWALQRETERQREVEAKKIWIETEAALKERKRTAKWNF